MKIVRRPILTPGTKVAVANCVTTGTVIRRVRPNCYLVAFKGAEIEMPRNQLAPAR